MAPDDSCQGDFPAGIHKLIPKSFSKDYGEISVNYIDHSGHLEYLVLGNRKNITENYIWQPRNLG